jgi:DNA-binding NarL/FixJ family response regulator
MFRPSGIVLDIELPDASRHTALEHLKAHPATRQIPIHIVSVSDRTQQALELGAIGYALKPVERDELVKTLEKLEKIGEQGMRRMLVVEDIEAQRESVRNVDLVALSRQVSEEHAENPRAHSIEVRSGSPALVGH